MIELLSKKQVCQLLLISESTLNRLVKAKRIHPVKVGRRVLFEEEEVRRFIEECKTIPEGKEVT